MCERGQAGMAYKSDWSLSLAVSVQVENVVGKKRSTAALENALEVCE